MNNSYPRPTRVVPDPVSLQTLAIIDYKLCAPKFANRAAAWVYITHVEMGWIVPEYAPPKLERVRLTKEPVMERVRLSRI